MDSVLIALLTAMHTGDADAVDAAFTDGAEFVDGDDEPALQGVDAIRDHFLAFGGRRERFSVRNFEGSGDSWDVDWTLHYRADSAAFERRGRAHVNLDGERISRWDSTWEEDEVGLDAWGGD